jgi:predicted dinucleotide-binding enzyme
MTSSPGDFMNIGIIGAGNIGGNLTRRLTRAGHHVTVANSRGPETLADLAQETGAIAVWASEVAKDADLVIVTVPERTIPTLGQGLLDGLAPGTPVVDTGNYYPRQRDGRIDAIEAGTTESRWVSQQLGHPVVKAFNNIYAQHLIDKAKPSGTPGRVALPVAGDEPDTKATIMRLIDEIGFDPVDAGTLDESWRQQPGAPVYGTDYDIEGVTKALAEASPDRPEEHRA